MAEGKDKKYIVESLQDGGWGLFEIKRSMSVPVAVFGQGDNDLVDLICFFLNTGLSEEELLDIEHPEDDDNVPKRLSVDQYLRSIAERV